MSRKKFLRRRRTPQMQEIDMNYDTMHDFYMRLRKIALARFEWVNLPESMDGRFLERCLFEYGEASLLHHNTYGYINTKCSTDGGLNIYEMPTALRCYATGNMISEVRRVYNGLTEPNPDENTECIHVLNTIDTDGSPYATKRTIDIFAYRLYEAERTSDVNIKAQKTPYLLLTNESQRFTIENLFNKIRNNEPVIIGDSDLLTMDSVKSINTNAPYVADKLGEYKKEIWNEALTYLGINNLSEKKERLITDETNSNNELINMNLQSFLASRKKACEQFNKKYGLEGDNAIDVKVRSDLLNIIKKEESLVKYDYPDDFEDMDDENTTTDLGEGA